MKKNIQKNIRWLKRKQYMGFRKEPHRTGLHGIGMSISEEALKLPHDVFKKMYKDYRGIYYY